MNTNKFNMLMALTSILMLMVACATQPAYQSAQKGGYGYSERQLTDDQFRIHFKGRGDDTGRAMDYAMLRASELTLENGFDWFDIASRETLVDREPVPFSSSALSVSYATVQDCGLLSCTAYYRPVPEYHTSASMGNQRREVEVIMEVRMGRGVRPSDQNSYDARELYSRLNREA